ASRPLVLVVPALLPDPDLERRKAVALAQVGQAAGLVLGGDVAAHARRVGIDRAGRPPQQLAHARSLQLAAQVPERGVDAAQRTADLRTGELVLGVENSCRDSGL